MAEPRVLVLGDSFVRLFCDFVRLLHDTYGVKVVGVRQTIIRQGALVFNRKAKLLTKYLRVV